MAEACCFCLEADAGMKVLLEPEMTRFLPSWPCEDLARDCWEYWCSLRPAATFLFKRICIVEVLAPLNEELGLILVALLQSLPCWYKLKPFRIWRLFSNEEANAASVFCLAICYPYGFLNVLACKATKFYSARSPSVLLAPARAYVLCPVT